MEAHYNACSSIAQVQVPYHACEPQGLLAATPFQYIAQAASCPHAEVEGEGHAVQQRGTLIVREVSLESACGHTCVRVHVRGHV